MRFIDPDISRKKKVVDKNVDRQPAASQAPLFSILEINLCGSCTRKCKFCPHSDPNYPRNNEQMPLALFEKLMAELGTADFDGTVIFSAFCEPLLHKQVESFIESAKKYCPKARIELITNGDLLTPDKLTGLFKAGLTVLCVSMYDGPQQQEKFKAMQKEAGLRDDQMVFRVRWLSANEQYGITLTNRGGAIEIKEAGVVTPGEPLNKPCYYPFYQTLVDYDGSVILCTHDWNKKLIAGNIKREPILGIWNNDILKKIRLNLIGSNRRFPPCDRCNAEGLYMGKGHFDKWVKYYEITG